MRKNNQKSKILADEQERETAEDILTGDLDPAENEPLDPNDNKQEVAESESA